MTCPLARGDGLGERIVGSAVFFAAGIGLILRVRHVLLRELRQARAVAGAAQSVLLRPLPPRIDGLALAAGQLSADRGASVGGDLYDVVATDHGVRVVMGDVRGHGLAALATAAAVLGSFREAAHDEAELARVLRRLERGHARHVRQRSRDEHPSAGGGRPQHPLAEEFVTVLLLEIRRDGAVHALNCGHPWPYLLRPEAERPAVPVRGGDPLPPLGVLPLPDRLVPVRCGRLLPGEGLLLHTDGVEDARDAHGRFFPLPSVVADVVRHRTVAPAAVLHGVYDRFVRHVAGPLGDDAALLVLRNDRSRVPQQAGEPLARPAHTVP
ncbi:serine/threonine-protein phosphatase [Streptomyces sp. GXMU-J5]|uniref:Serine/threonine-protein phosphatase n=2 Tax=Streptomyces beihaiensis TaxID=2984495 RepID=A0ABT3TZN5_9ACTN|nr:PP2C family protein-serine/threonine phosphatase [Streptomyces beihaiensis]MCX3062489.1 serine/threonine-protein phosphatase [Streptomyces beihaiensis]